MTTCTHALTCAAAPAAVVPAPVRIRLAPADQVQPLPLVPARPARLGSAPPTPPPNR